MAWDHRLHRPEEWVERRQPGYNEREAVYSGVVDVADVGPLPTKAPPEVGESFVIRLPGRPPIKTFGRSMRNRTSPERPRFMALRDAAISAMDGRKWFEGSVQLELIYRAPDPPNILDEGFGYLSGIMDTLGASQGPSFVYLPIVYLDDCQVGPASVMPEPADAEEYELRVTFVEADDHST